ncbi:glycerophosphodiester phosphodiesterase [Gymnodinialimonas hymeniacidonis]|uniref:glycerophosphodiester phosphodiesterase n=1 Tax=Gymnodinialimonas hymeniacidonis TaxID=3126508 RepID=UPI0034C61BF1
MTHPFLDFEGCVGFAHRGGALEAEENTAEAFAYAAGLGFTHIETDVHLSRDGVVVVHHDDTFERMFGDARAVAEMDWAEIATLRTAAGAEVPRLDEVLAAFPQTFFNIELKCLEVAAPLAEVISRADALDRVCVGAFDPKNTAAIRGMLGEGLCWSPAHAGVARLWAAGWGVPVGRLPYPVVQVPTAFNGIPVVTGRVQRAAQKRGVKVQVWTVDDRAEMERLLDLGVDGIMSDRPSVLKEVLQARGAWHS